MSKAKIVWLSILGLVVFLVVLFIFGLFGLGWFAFFGPKTEDVRRNIFENTQSYVQGKVQELGKYHAEYQQADEAGKIAIKATILIRFAEFDEQKIRPLNLRNFLVKMRGY